MSFSNPELTNPAQHFFEWKGGEGKLQFYDKEKKENVTMPLPFEFIPIDQLATITGYSKAAKRSYYSNEVRSSVKDVLNVKLNGQTVFTGLYKNDQGIAQVPKGAGFTAAIYIVHKNSKGEYILGNFRANGSALGAWIEFNKNKIVGNGKCVMTKGAVQTSPVGDFYPPEFKYEHLTDEDYKAATDADKELQIYLSQYLARNAVEDAQPPQEAVAPEITEEQVRANQAATTANKQLEDEEDQEALDRAKRADDVVIDDFGDEPINLDDIPF